MPEYCFFKKGEHVNVLDSNDTKGAACLREWGYIKQSEKLHAENIHCALARFHDIQNKEQTSEHAFSTGAILVVLLICLIAVVDWLFL